MFIIPATTTTSTTDNRAPTLVRMSRAKALTFIEDIAKLYYKLNEELI
jgi:hypothetical protein